MIKFSNTISVLFHPLLMATYGCLLLFFGFQNSIYDVFTPLKLKLIITLTVFSFTALLPALNLLILYKVNLVSSLKIEQKEERTLPFIITALCYFGLYYLIYEFTIWPAIKLFVLGAGCCIMIVAIINSWYKISAHTVGIGGLIGAVFAISYYVKIPAFSAISVILIIAGLVAFSRLALNAHTPKQVYSGFLLGCVLQCTLFFIAQHPNLFR